MTKQKKTESKKIVGIHNRLPAIPGRCAEGGIRLHIQKKNAINKKIPLVSAITVSRNSAKTIEQTINSIRNQSYSNIEYIVIDACSDDGTIEILAENENIIDYFVSEPDAGLYNAMNKGLSVASGDFIIILNSDDYYTEDCIEKLVNYKQITGADFTSALCMYINTDNKKLYTLGSSPFDAHVRFRMPLRHETMLISQNIYNQIGGYSENLKIIADLDLTIRLYENNFFMAELRKPLLYFRNSGVSSTDINSLVRERKILIGHQFPELQTAELEILAQALDKPGELTKLLSRYKNNRKLFKSLLDLIGRTYKKILEEDDVKKLYPRISLVLVVKNNSQTLKHVLDSILCQTFSEFELICVNDFSSDNSLKIIEEYSKKDNRIFIVNNKMSPGCEVSKNQGVRNSIGKYIMFLNPEEIIPEYALGRLVHEGDGGCSDLVIAKLLLRGFHAGKSKYSERQHPEYLYLYKNELAKNICYPMDLPAAASILYQIRAIQIASKITRIIINDSLRISEFLRGSIWNGWPEIIFKIWSRLPPVKIVRLIGKVSLIIEVVNIYLKFSEKPVNRVSFQNSIEWRRRSVKYLEETHLIFYRKKIFQALWNESLFINMAEKLERNEICNLLENIQSVIDEIQIPAARVKNRSKFLQQIFSMIAKNRLEEAAEFIYSRKSNRFESHFRKSDQKTTGLE